MSVIDLFHSNYQPECPIHTVEVSLACISTSLANCIGCVEVVQAFPNGLHIQARETANIVRLGLKRH